MTFIAMRKRIFVFKTKNIIKNSWKHCHGCRKQECIDYVNLKGRIVPYLSYDVEISIDVVVIGCTQCDNFILGPGDCELLDQACQYVIDHS